MYLCQICLREGKYNCNDIEVHHAVKIDENPEIAFEPSNLLTLCKDHHDQADVGKISFGTIKEIIEEQEKNKFHRDLSKLSKLSRNKNPELAFKPSDLIKAMLIKVA
jgi:hypothetical protein